jgi:hypothetical protein
MVFPSKYQIAKGRADGNQAVEIKNHNFLTLDL